MKPSQYKTVDGYITIYVGDLWIVLKDPEGLLKQLKAKLYKFKLKGPGLLNFRLGCGFECNENGTLCMDSVRYDDYMEQAYE